MKNSGDLERQEIERMIELARNRLQKKVLVAQGTGTLNDNSVELEKALQHYDKVAILFGSEAPLVGVTPSDAPLILGRAFSGLELLPSGVYVAGHRGIIKPGNVKVSENGQVLSISNSYISLTDIVKR